MKCHHWIKKCSFTLIFVLLLLGCRESDGELGTTETAVPATPTTIAIAEETTSAIEPTPTTSPPIKNSNYLIIATDAPVPPFTDFDEFGEIIGFNGALIENLVTAAQFDGYEFVVTPHEGVLESIAQQPTGDFDAVLSTLVIPAVPPDGLAYTQPYLEIGQVMVVLADNTAVQSYRDLPATDTIGIQQHSRAEEAVRNVLQRSDETIAFFDNNETALQALIDEEIQAVVIDHFNGRYFTEKFPEQLKIVGGTEQDAWLSSKQFGIALAAEKNDLLQRLNSAISQLQNNNIVEQLSTTWLVSDNSRIIPGESRVGTAQSELVIGILGVMPDMDPASNPNLISWEVKNNTMSGLYTIDPQSQTIPTLALGQPAISEDGTEYTIELKQGLLFSDGTPFTANAVKDSILRSARLGNFLVNGFLKDSNTDGFADDDAVQVLGQFTVKIVLQAPVNYFTNLLATPPYYPVNVNCYAPTFDPTSICGGIGPYTIADWGEGELRLKANPQWPNLPPPTFENIRLRFFTDSASLQNSLLNFQSIDIAWTGLDSNELNSLEAVDNNGDGTADFTAWQGPAIFKSYLMFDQATPPWDNKKVRQAVALSIDRAALANDTFGGNRTPLLSPVPDGVLGQLPVLPERNLTQAQALLLEVGYSETTPLPITLWFINDGRYSPIEDQYATAVKTQLEETNVFQVTLQSAPWDIYVNQIFSCGYDFYLMGWPSPTAPPNYLHITSWTDFFLSSRSFCSNYESEPMLELAAEAEAEIDQAASIALYQQMQQLWADELPTLDLLQEPRRLIAIPEISGVQIDSMGLLHYELLTKGTTTP